MSASRDAEMALETLASAALRERVLRLLGPEFEEAAWEAWWALLAGEGEEREGAWADPEELRAQVAEMVELLPAEMRERMRAAGEAAVAAVESRFYGRHMA